MQWIAGWQVTKPMTGHWQQAPGIAVRNFTCGFCDAFVASSVGLAFLCPQSGNQTTATIAVCPHCLRPSFFEGNSQTPGPPFGGKVDHISADVDSLYQEARRCTSTGAYTAAVLACRKLLMHVAVDKGADAGRSFMDYVEHLSQKGYITPDAHGWVDEIRKKGNEANHEIRIMNQSDAKDLLGLIEMLLKIIYEFPGRLPRPTGGTPGEAG